MDDLEKVYCVEMDPVAHALQILPADMDFTWLENSVWEHERALDLVSTQLSKRVLDNYNEFGVICLQHKILTHFSSGGNAAYSRSWH